MGNKNIEIDFDNELWKVNETREHSEFLKCLSKWIIGVSGNVNVAQRLNVIAIGMEENEKVS